ncbi:hypothetical protein DCAR_0727774 [Daucus carota subsp. sativus]|uniref:Uncharacterized protein n=1 Tax=Daucus carota subsp. sativus TaxID=79200 RepID=A0A164TDR7_DAUCS|nr:hypothetical protein DCAR_0727774 [Daucus carota subsp. sativus]
MDGENNELVLQDTFAQDTAVMVEDPNIFEALYENYLYGLGLFVLFWVFGYLPEDLPTNSAAQTRAPQNHRPDLVFQHPVSTKEYTLEASQEIKLPIFATSYAPADIKQMGMVFPFKPMITYENLQYFVHTPKVFLRQQPARVEPINSRSPKGRKGNRRVEP